MTDRSRQFHLKNQPPEPSFLLAAATPGSPAPWGWDLLVWLAGTTGRLRRPYVLTSRSSHPWL